MTYFKQIMLTAGLLVLLAESCRGTNALLNADSVFADGGFLLGIAVLYLFVFAFTRTWRIKWSVFFKWLRSAF